MTTASYHHSADLRHAHVPPDPRVDLVRRHAGQGHVHQQGVVGLDHVDRGLPARSPARRALRNPVGRREKLPVQPVGALEHGERLPGAADPAGGNGAIESFSILPRLYRDMVVLESWEGTHNVLCLQVMRDIARYQLHEPLLRYLKGEELITHLGLEYYD